MTLGGVMPKPILQWACRELCGGWMMIGVDVDLSAPGEPEALLGYRRAIRPDHFDECKNSQAVFCEVVAEMTDRIQMGLGESERAQTQSASRACAFEISDEDLASLIQYRLGEQ